MVRTLRLLSSAAVLLLPFPLFSQSGSFNLNGATSVSVNIAPEAAIRIDSATTALSTTGNVFANPFAGSTGFTYKVRTTPGGNANIQLQVTSDFSPTGGPSVTSPLSPEDKLTYTCSVAQPATGCSGTQVAGTATTSVATFGGNAHSGANGNTGTLNWVLANDPQYATGSYSATITITISAT